MGDAIILILLAAAIVAGVLYSIRHFKGKGGCCGGGDYKPRKKRLSHVAGEKTFLVEGMHCAHCKARVEDAVNVGDMIWVKVTDIDEKGRVNLSHIDAIREIKAKKLAKQN